MQKEITIGTLSAKIVEQTGYSTSGRIRFEAWAPEPITAGQCEEAQQKLGYHPMGYDFFGFVCEVEGEGYRARWSCAASCD